MEMNERLKIFADISGLTQYRISKDVGLSTAAINLVFKGESGLSMKSLVRLKSAYPNLNLNWLIAGEGNIIQKRRNTRAYKG